MVNFPITNSSSNENLFAGVCIPQERKKVFFNWWQDKDL